MSLALLLHSAVLLHDVNSQWLWKSRGKVIIRAVRQQLPWHWLSVVNWPRGIKQKIWAGSVDLASAGGFWHSLKESKRTTEQDNWYQGLLFCKKLGRKRR